MSEAQTETPQSHLEVGDESQHSTPHSLGEKQYSGFETDRTDKEGGGDGDNPFDIELTQVSISEIQDVKPLFWRWIFFLI